MASTHPVTELDSGTADSVSSTPRSEHHHLHDDSAAVQHTRVRFMCSFGGKILPRPHDNLLRYVGGDTRIVAIHRHITFSSFLSKLSKLSGTTNISIKYQLPSEDLDSLITVTTDEDVENMMDEYDPLSQNQKMARLRLFLFSTDADSRASSISSLLDGSAKRQNWFSDALNGGWGPVLERGRSEVSSIVSEVPDYLFGLDNSDDAIRESKLKNKNDNVSFSDPGSPTPVVSSPFCSTASSLAPPSTPGIPDIPPLRTKPVNPNLVPAVEHKYSQAIEGVAEVVTDKMGHPQTGFSGAPMGHYPVQTVQHIPTPAVYYVPGPVQTGSNLFPPVPIQTRYQQLPLAPGQVPVGYPQSQPIPGVNLVYGAGVMPYEMTTRLMQESANQKVYFRTRDAVPIPGSYPGTVISGREEMQGFGKEGTAGRVSHES
ncbi:uncharacterized protein LOC111368731 [Olea europaea var. sylvestris]|uniref:Octicosapeptide Phox Bem1p family, isoform 1 n=1 Tax=Olea europaea subsp. europaea TaxID=158383 RepID=A0A8S0RRP3_OLEEU|nr:uncharacterized protein LOC111368731 [Olea europaea var. sylvestris]XP_022845919.1 uncharacterized protein LOC111368731 [Olea europaea var. sylvestris]CAA2982556.1 Octicosapeptide Phox Bem1p family, isoform 1 [Olea europaea subsp. europaea]